MQIFSSEALTLTNWLKDKKGIEIWLKPCGKVKIPALGIKNGQKKKEKKKRFNKANSAADLMWPTWLVTEAILLIGPALIYRRDSPQ